MGRLYRTAFAAAAGSFALSPGAATLAQAPAAPYVYPTAGYPTTGSPASPAPAYTIPPYQTPAYPATGYPTTGAGAAALLAPPPLPASPAPPASATPPAAPPQQLPAVGPALVGAAQGEPLPPPPVGPAIGFTPPPFPAPPVPPPAPAAPTATTSSVPAATPAAAPARPPLPTAAAEGASAIVDTATDAPPLDPALVEGTPSEETPSAAPVSWYRPNTWFRADPWDIGFELGINGSTGTSETLSLRTGGYLKRETDRSKLDTSLYYNKTSADGADTQSNALLKTRHDCLFADSPWTLFVSNQVFYDEFQAFDLNVNINSGIGYQVFDTEWVKLVTSFGAGASREFGGVVDRWEPEAQFGFDWEQKVSDTQRFYANLDYFPGFEDFGDYRILTDMGLEIDLARPSNVSLKLSATDRFDSTPDGVSPHNTNYSVLLLWKR